MLILIDDDFSHLYIPTEQIKTAPNFFRLLTILYIGGGHFIGGGH